MHMTLIHFLMVIHCFQFRNKTLSSFSEWYALMDKCLPRHAWRVFQLALTSHLLIVNSDIISLQFIVFLSKYFLSFSPHLHRNVFPIVELYLTDFFFQLPPVLLINSLYFQPCIKKQNSKKKRKIQNSRVNNSTIWWIRKFLEYRLKQTRTYIRRFLNALFYCYRMSNKNARCAITTLYHFSRKAPFCGQFWET